MEETITNLAPALIQLESNTAAEIVRQVMIYKYIELGVTFAIATIILLGFGLLMSKMMSDF